jgi:electron transfer flavoprotein alpha subunit
LNNLSFDKIIYYQNSSLKNYLGEKYLPVLEEIYKKEAPDFVIFFGDINGNELAVRFSYRVSGSIYTEIRKLYSENNNYFIEKPIYSHNIVSKLLLEKNPFILTLGKGHYNPKETKGNPKIIDHKSDVKISKPSEFIEFSTEFVSVDDGIESANKILIAGRGIESKSNLKEMEDLASNLNAAVGITRVVALNSWKEKDYMIGISGHIIQPELCIVFGASGATPFMAGIEKSEVIIAINNDPKALIFKKSDVGVVADSEELIKELNNLNKNNEF